VDLTIADLPSPFDGYTIVAFADLHHRHPFRDVRWLRHAVDLANANTPDLVALLGDYGSSFKRAPLLSRVWYARALPLMTPELQRLQAADGMVAVLGNHDYYAGIQAATAWLRDVGARVLVNQSHHISRAGHCIRVIGLDDLHEGREPAFDTPSLSESVPSIVLAHHPDSILKLPSSLRVDGMIAGHTHGGQIVVPWLGAPLTMARICTARNASGWISNKRAPLYVSRGLGEQLPIAMRICCSPELLVLRLRQAA
jgi:predicted MPP superfamily phosphohydrolase